MLKVLLRGFFLIVMIGSLGGCRSHSPSGQASPPSAPPSVNNGLISSVGQSVAYDQAGGRDPYTSPAGTGDFVPNSRR